MISIRWFLDMPDWALHDYTASALFFNLYTVLWKVLASLLILFFYCFVILCHLCMCQIIKRIVILDKDNTGKHKIQFLNDYFIIWEKFWEKKAIQTHLEPIWKKKKATRKRLGKSHPWESKNHRWPKRAQKLVSHLLKKHILIPKY